MKPKYFELAKKVSYKSIHKFRLGCIIVKGNRILGLGYNSIKTHPRSNCPFKTLHAECDALISCGLDGARGATAYVYRATKDGCESDSKPCVNCEKMLQSAGVKKVYYTKSQYPYWDVIKF